MKTFQYVFTDEAPRSLSFELDGSETLVVDQQAIGTVVYANKSTCRVLAQIFAKLALGDYDSGFHVHLQRDFQEDSSPDVLTLVLTEE